MITICIPIFTIVTIKEITKESQVDFYLTYETARLTNNDKIINPIVANHTKIFLITLFFVENPMLFHLI